ncbi:ATP-binding protein, partial [Metasolibacillus meyeri]|uniref:hybrid sensor histidine kinase/response regulator n=1 Tax=Metasolibacillus meyeri TaxID=1071052 RepID=UPI001EE6EC9F
HKEELFFGLFAILLGIYMLFINQKIFFLLVTIEEATVQVRLQLGTLILALMCLTLFIYYMYPKLTKKKNIHFLMVFLCILFVIYGIRNPFFGEIATSPEEIKVRQFIFLALIAPILIYNIGILMRVLIQRLEEARYVLIVVTAIYCYALLLMMNFLTDIPFDYSEFVLFILILVGFSLLLNFRANVTFTKIQKLSEELLTHNQMKDEFLIKTSHELRTPLNGILNLAKSLMEGMQGPLKRNQQEQVILIHNVTQRLGHLVEDLLFSSHHMTGEINITPTAVPITIINEVAEEIRSVMSSDSRVNLRTNIDTTLPFMWTDELRFKQVLYNLLHNAIQHTEIGEITVTAYVQQQQMAIQVSDTGVGIHVQDLEHIFNAFYQARKQSNKEGLGLGLSITKNIIEKLNGEIYVESVPEEGTTFTFTMPLVKQNNGQLINAPKSAFQTVLQLDLPLIHKGYNKTLLIVDDDHTNIKVLADACMARGYSVIAVDNGVDALQYIQKHEVDCLLTDLLMDGMSGYELCKQVRKQYDMLELPIIVLTAIMKQSDLLLTLQVGANDYLQKPVVMDELFIRIESLLAI